MKTRFSTLDIIAILPELKAKLCTGWRVNQIFDCDQKTYLLKLNKSIVQMKKDDDPLSVDEETANKMAFIIESGIRLHSTDFDWPKPHAPSQFATKLRKHIKNKRIDDIRQVGIDRLVDMQFGTNLAANHLLIELYDKGNLILTDHEYRIIAMLRWRKSLETANVASDPTSSHEDSENFKVGQIYPLSRSRTQDDLEPMTVEKIAELINNAKILLGSSHNRKKRNKVKQDIDDGTLEINLKDLLNPHVIYGSSLLEDKLLKHLSKHIGTELKKCVIKVDVVNERGSLDKEQVMRYAKCVHIALDEADEVMREVKSRSKSPGYIIQKKITSEINEEISKGKKDTDKRVDDLPKTANIDFFPILTCAERRVQMESEDLTYQEFESFDKAVDVYYCNMESQKIDSKAFSAEKEAMKKLENLKIAQEKRLDDLARTQKDDEERARLIELNNDKVENALLIIRSMIANQIAWSDIWTTIKQAQAMKDPIASLITAVRFERNEFTMKLCDPYDADGEDAEGNTRDNNKGKGQKPKYRNVDIDIGLSAFANARKFFVKRRTAVNKEKKTIEVSKKAFKNVERQTKEKLKEVIVKTNITKARKRYWFENFFWFISTDGYLVVAGRDAEQNEMLVKRYMKKGDIYVHADLHGGSSVVVKNEFSDRPIPPKTLEEAGTMAVCYSSAWESKIATTSYWVYPNQVSKTPQTGEYLSLGGFIIRGKKNFLPLSNLVLGFGFLFRMGEESIERRRDNRVAKELMIKEQAENNRGLEQADQASEVGDTTDVGEDEQSLNDQDLEVDGNGISDAANSDVNNAPGEQSADKSEANEVNDDEDDDDLDDDDDDTKGVEHRLIDTITESALPDDVLLYAIPMCGPYSALQCFKFKVKVVPGANKRGKAAKACLGMFLHDKNSSQRERDLLRSLKDQDYARNIPNNVKISAANLRTITKRKPKRQEVRLPL